MADTHDDRDLSGVREASEDLLQRMKQKAAAMTAAQTNTFTAGRLGETVLHEEEVGVFLIRKLPEDPDCLRVSIGEPSVVGPGAYVVIRGRTSSAIELIERALAALRVSRIESAGD